MTKSLIKCNLIWFILATIVGFTAMSTLKPDLMKDLLTGNVSGLVDFFNLKSKPKTTRETYIKRDIDSVEPSAFEYSQ